MDKVVGVAWSKQSVAWCVMNKAVDVVWRGVKAVNVTWCEQGGEWVWRGVVCSAPCHCII